jgi:hypothetical protein
MGAEEWGIGWAFKINIEMKKIIFLSFISFFKCLSQDIDYKSSYRLLIGVNIKECDDNGANPSTDVFARKGFVFSIEGKAGDDFIISFLPWKEGNGFNIENSLNNNTYYRNTSRTGNLSSRKYYLLKKEDFNDKALIEKVINGGLTFGSLTVPIKIRPKIDKTFSDFEGNINVGFAGGFRLKPSQRGTVQNFLFGINLTQIPLDAINTNGFLKESDKINGSGISFYGAYVLEVKGFQFGAFMGCDYLGKEIGTKWQYNNKTWFGLGLGLNIFKNESKQLDQD